MENRAIGNDDEIMQLVTEDTKVIDAKHNTVIPGCATPMYMWHSLRRCIKVQIFLHCKRCNEPRKQYMERLLKMLRNMQKSIRKAAIMGGMVPGRL